MTPEGWLFSTYTMVEGDLTPLFCPGPYPGSHQTPLQLPLLPGTFQNFFPSILKCLKHLARLPRKGCSFRAKGTGCFLFSLRSLCLTVRNIRELTHWKLCFHFSACQTLGLTTTQGTLVPILRARSLN